MLDAWRGVASLAVVAYHMAQIIEYRWNDLVGYPVYAASHYGWAGVTVFFVVSGYCIAGAAMSTLRKDEGIGRYAYARVRRIFPTYWWGLLLAALFSAAAQMMVARGKMTPNVFTENGVIGQDALYYLSNLTLTPILVNRPFLLAVAWTLAYEIAFYLIVGVAMVAAARRFGPRGVFVALHALTVATLAVLLVAPKSSFYPLDLWPQFGFGILVYDLLTQPVGRIARASWAWAGAMAALTAAFILRYNMGVGYMLQDSRIAFGLALLTAVLLLVLHRYDERASATKTGRALAFIGLFSYSLYLTHTIVIRVVSQGFRMLNVPQGAHLLMFLVGIIAATAFAYVFFLLCERPFIRSRRQIAAHATSPAAAHALGVAESAVREPVTEQQQRAAAAGETIA